MITSSYQSWLLTTWALLSLTTAQAGITAQTDLASIAITPLTRQANATADWQTIYDYSGGDVLPPGTRLTSDGKWIDPVVRKDQSGVTFAFPDLPDQPQAAQFLNIAFAVERPIANYPTRTTIHYTSNRDQAAHVRSAWWSPFLLTTGDPNYTILSGGIRGLDPMDEAKIPIHLTGENTLVFSFDGNGSTTVTLNDQDASAFLKNGDRPIAKSLPQPGALLMPGIALRNKLNQVPGDKGDWFAIHSFKIEQMRPPLDASAVAAVDLTVPGSDPIRTTIEIVDDKNDSIGYLLRDALVSPGKYRLYWDGISQKQTMPKNATWVSSGSYTFHLTTSRTVARYAGEINNSTPEYNAQSYGVVDCTALALTPPGTPVRAEWSDENYGVDTRKFDATDSMQLLCVGYDAKSGQWIGADGTVIHTRTGDARMQYGRGLTVTPPDPGDPTNPQKEFYFTSKTIGSGNALVSCSLPAGLQKPVSKMLTSPDWNRPAAGFWPYKVHIGHLPDLIGPQHNLFFLTGRLPKGQELHAEWIFRNIRLYEEGSPDPGPTVTFDRAKFTARYPANEKNPPAIPPDSVTVEDNGHAVHLKNAISVNYPFDYTVTPRTILAFDVDVIDRSNCGLLNGIGLHPDSSASQDDNLHSFNFLGQLEGDPRFGFYEPSLGAYAYPTYEPNTLYTDSAPMPPLGAPFTTETTFLWQPGFYGVKASEDGKLLFACNNADNRLEVRDISTDGGVIAKIPIDYPMFVSLAPEGAAGASEGMRYIYVDSPSEGIVRIAWHLADNTFGKPEKLTPAAEFAYPRGIAYDAAANLLFVCDTFNYDRSKVANQIAVIDPQTGKVLSRFGKQGGVDPKTGGAINEEVFTCPLTIEADSKGALWVNDYYSCEVRKYDFDPASNGFKLERRVLGSNTTNTSHFYWMPGDPPTKAWTVAGFFVRNEADIGSDGRFTNQRTTSATYQVLNDVLRPYAHFTKIGDHVYGVFYSDVYEQVGDGWVPSFKFGNNAGNAARKAGLLAKPGEPPTELDKAIAASGDKDWEKRCWAWSDLNGDGRINYSAASPEFQIAFNSDIAFDGYIPPTGCLRSPDGAFVHTTKGGLAVIPPKIFNGKTLYSWENAKVIPRIDTIPASDVLAQDGRYYTLGISTQRHDMGDKVINKIECYDDTGKLLWTRDQSDFSLLCLQSLGDGMISIMDRGGWTTEGPIMIRTSDGDLVSQVYCRQPGDCWSNGALRSDADTAYIGLVQAYKVTGLSTARSTTATVSLPAGGP